MSIFPPEENKTNCQGDCCHTNIPLVKIFTRNEMIAAVTIIDPDGYNLQKIEENCGGVGMQEVLHPVKERAQLRQTQTHG